MPNNPLPYCIFPPNFSYDLRQHGGGLHWSDDSVFGHRAQFESRRHPLTLSVDPVKSKDQGIYRCRVDFERGPSKTYSVKLIVIGKSRIQEQSQLWSLNFFVVRRVYCPCETFLQSRELKAKK